MARLRVKGLEVKVEGIRVVTEASFAVEREEVVVIRGQNGSGKSSLARALAGSVRYVVTNGGIEWEGNDWEGVEMDERARQGLYLAWQNPPMIEGVKVFNLVRESLRAKEIKVESMVELKKKLQRELEEVGLPENFWQKEINVGMSGGEKKRLEAVVMKLSAPKLAILDELDSGLDREGIEAVGKIVRQMRGKGTSFLVITHGEQLLSELKVNRVLIMRRGKLTKMERRQ